MNDFSLIMFTAGLVMMTIGALIILLEEREGSRRSD